MDPWLRITFLIPESSEEELIASLHESGCLGAEQSTERLHAYFPANVDAGPLIEKLRRSLGPAAAAMKVEAVGTVSDGRWHERWLEGLSPMKVGKSFLIVPGPTTPDDTKGRWLIRLSPGRAFGTGEHSTTRMCLELLEDRAGRGGSVLDIGTGSGILAIAARMAGATPVTAIDLDPIAVELASRNAALNGVVGIRWIAGGLDSLASFGTDHIVSNLDATALSRLMRDIAGRLLKEAIVSGILAHEEAGVLSAAAREGLMVTERRRQGEWLCLALARS